MTTPNDTEEIEAMPESIRCENATCDFAGSWDDCDERTEPGETIPHEVCPKCGHDTFVPN